MRHVALLLILALVCAACTRASGSTTETDQPTASTPPPPTFDGSPPKGSTTTWPQYDGPMFYVSPGGNGSDGSSWTRAWQELADIDWSVVGPGSTIVLDGGDAGITYQTTLEVGASGTAEEPIRIHASDEPGRAGTVRIYGGRAVPLPACHSERWEYDGPRDRPYGIRVEGQSHIEIDGERWGGILIQGHSEAGVRLAPGVSHIELANLEITDNGSARLAGSGGSRFPGRWYPEGPGIRIAGFDLTLRRLNVHDNGQDAIQSTYNGTLGDVTVSESWLHNERPHPELTESWNFCTHTDGMQIYSGGEQAGFLFEKVVIGPGFQNGLILGQRLKGDNVASVSDVTVRDSLILRTGATSFGNGLVAMNDIDPLPSGWTLERVTALTPIPGQDARGRTPGNGYIAAMNLAASDITITDSVFVGGHLNFPEDKPEGNGNCAWETWSELPGDDTLEIDPGFSLADEAAVLSVEDDLTVTTAGCTGSSLTSIGAFFELVTG